jgi:signal peptidase II
VKSLWLVPLILLVDQVTKLVVAGTMGEGSSIPVLGDFFRLTYIHNRGAAFGVDIGNPWLHTLVAVVALGVLVWLFRSTPSHARLLRWSLSMVLGGAVGNLVDRVRLQQVVDFLDFGLGSLRWPVFNVADSFVTVGIFMLAIGYSRQREADQPSRESRAPDGQILER